MRRIVCLAIPLLLMAPAARADDKDDVKAVIDKAIKAMGGAEKLSKFQAHTFKGTGKYYGMGEGIDYTGEWAIQHPDKMRMQITVAVGDMKFTFVRVVNGDMVWSKMGDDTTAGDKDMVAEAKEGGHAGLVASLLPLKEKGYELKSLGDFEVGEKKAVGVRVSHKGHRDVDLYFDKAKGLLLKSESTVKDEMSGQEVKQESLYSDYKDVDGIQTAMKLAINRDGKAYVTVDIAECEYKEKIDDSVFGKP